MPGTVGPAESYRFDLAIAEDIVEEIARLYGYDELPVATAGLPVPLARMQAVRRPHRLIDSAISWSTATYQEVLTYSFVSEAQQRLCEGDTARLGSRKPDSSHDLAVMRRSLLPGLAACAASNRARQVDRLRLFETGKSVSSRARARCSNSRESPVSLAALASRRAGAAQVEPVDFYDVKADVESLAWDNALLVPFGSPLRTLHCIPAKRRP